MVTILSRPVNLLPPEEKRKLRLRYLLSLATLFFVLVALAVAAGAALLVPSYLVAKNAEESATRNLDSIEKILGLKEKAGANASVLELSERVGILGSYSYTPAVMPVLSAVGASLVKGASVRTVKIKETENGKGTVTISGVADTRAALLSFSNALKAERIFSGVSIPVEQLAHEADISFSLTFPYALP